MAPSSDLSMLSLRAAACSASSCRSTTSSTPLMVISPSTRGGAASVKVRTRAAATMTCASARSLMRISWPPSCHSLDQADGEAAARHVAADRLAHLGLELLGARRQTQAHVEAAAVDAAHLPVPGGSRRGAFRARKAGHALDAHRGSVGSTRQGAQRVAKSSGTGAGQQAARRERMAGTGYRGLSRYCFGLRTGSGTVAGRWAAAAAGLR